MEKFAEFRPSTESTVNCFKFNKEMTNALLFWREYTTNRPLKQSSCHRCLSLSDVRLQQFDSVAVSLNVRCCLVHIEEFCAGKHTVRQLSLFVHCSLWLLKEYDTYAHADSVWQFHKNTKCCVYSAPAWCLMGDRGKKTPVHVFML